MIYDLAVTSNLSDQGHERTKVKVTASLLLTLDTSRLHLTPSILRGDDCVRHWYQGKWQGTKGALSSISKIIRNT